MVSGLINGFVNLWEISLLLPNGLKIMQSEINWIKISRRPQKLLVLRVLPEVDRFGNFRRNVRAFCHFLYCQDRKCEKSEREQQKRREGDKKMNEQCLLNPQQPNWQKIRNVKRKKCLITFPMTLISGFHHTCGRLFLSFFGWLHDWRSWKNSFF